MLSTNIQNIILFIVQILSLLFLIIYVIKTWEMASATRKAAEATEKSVIEMRETRDQETAPFIIAYFDIPPETHYIYLVIKNIGKTVANKVKLTFFPELTSSNGKKDFNNVGFIKTGIESMPPNYEIRTFFDMSHAYFSSPELPLKYNVQIEYFGGTTDKKRTVNQNLDLSSFIGTSFLSSKNIEDLVKEIENLVNETKDTKKAIQDIKNNISNGLYIANSRLLISNIESEKEITEENIIDIFNEFTTFWNITFNNERENGIGIKKLQMQISIICNQMTLLFSLNEKHLDNTSSLLKLNIIDRLQELATYKFYMDGGSSLEKFNQIGDSIISDIEIFKNEVENTVK